MADLKSSKRSMFSVPADVRNLLDVLDRDIDNIDDELASKQAISDAKIENHIYTADTLINTYLLTDYGAGGLILSTPYTKSIMPVSKNQSSIELNGVTVGDSAITEQWLIRFTADDNYTLIGSFSGLQGAGDIDTDFTSDNGDIIIPTANWYNPNTETIRTGEQFLFATYIAHSTVNTLSAMLATSFLIDALYSNGDSHESLWGKKMYSKAMKIIRDIADSDSAASLDGVRAEDSIPMWQTTGFEIDGYGRDTAEYEEVTDDYSPFG